MIYFNKVEGKRIFYLFFKAHVTFIMFAIQIVEKQILFIAVKIIYESSIRKTYRR
jgi:hypothetical protein